MAKGDAVEEIMRLVRDAAPGLSHRQLETIARRIYADMGGEMRYIPKRPALEKAWRLSDATAAGVPFAQAWREAGVARTSAYRAERRRTQWMR